MADRLKLSSESLILLRKRICDPKFIFSFFSDSPESNYSKLKFIISSSVSEACNNSVLLLGPRGCGQNEILELVLEDILKDYPEMISVIKLEGLLHSDDNSAIKEIANQLCLDNELIFSKMASFDENSQFMIAMLRECGLAHRTLIFILDEFDLFAQGKQKLLYSLLDALQSISSQAVVIGLSCRLDADQLLEKRVRSRFSHRKLLFVPPSKEDSLRLVEHVLLLPKDSSLPSRYVEQFNLKLHKILDDDKFKQIINNLTSIDSSFSHLLRFLFLAVSAMDMKSGFLSLDNFNSALLSSKRQPKQEYLNDCSILELYILVCMKRLEIKEQESYNFNSIMKEYKDIQNSFQTSDSYSRHVCLRAFEHLLECELIAFADNRITNMSIEFRPVKLLIFSHELYDGLKSYRSCPVILQKLLDR
ncbi:origin of replication complex subunit 4 [Impatiens glandulifera]|uniref:origin of replication complex subunit 4 n=1 Tax=Impatiens glandulifera TaxID=253017 RepID=UPI001FB095B9|nr:origin of replication complex subunit 4 [Impatiens glandulifera]